MSPLRAVAMQVGARDLFVLHEVDRNRMVNLDGVGRGGGWAGNVVVDPSDDPVLSRAMTEGISRLKTGVPVRIFGPYWASEAVAVAAGKSIVVFAGEGVASATDERLRAAAAEAVSRVSEVPVEKRLADELEVSQAALAIATMRPGSLEEAGRTVATKVAQALSCEFGAVLINGPQRRLFLSEEGWRPVADDEEIIAALLPLHAAGRDDILVEQDLSCSAFPYHPLSFEDGLVARVAVALGDHGNLGLLVAAHASGAPRGFTSLCQRVVSTMATTAEPVLSDALQRETLAAR